MRKIISVLCAILIIAGALPIVQASAADSGFVIEDGVLLSYTGTDTSISIPVDVHAIADSAFENNTTIKSVALNNSLYSIGNRAFCGCTSLATLTGGGNVSYVGALAFVNTKYLKESTVEFLTVGSVLISYNGTESDVYIPSAVSAIAPYAFLRNNNITSISAGRGLSSIGEGAFYECASLADINVTSSVTFVGADAFGGTKWLSNADDFAVIGDGILISYTGSAQKVNIPSDVRQIASNAFYFNSTITDVYIPSSVFSIGARAFFNCKKLMFAKLCNGLVMIGDEAFANCTSLVGISTVSTLSKIGKGAFINCTKLSYAMIKGKNLVIDYGAFANCVSLDTVLLSDNVSSIGDNAFYSDSNLSYITMPSGVIFISSSAFNKCSKMTVICDKTSFAYSALNSSFKTTQLRGDTGLDGEVDIVDATLVQRSLVQMYDLSNWQYAFADADFDAEVTIMDATYIQRIVAKLV